ncbi:hypothetical protein SAMN05216439_1282 [Methanobrevibacter gottschalkii]|uniref:Uncharacterized protein n=1 Tax=Methanobrevibacter gottschalkii TaxID=190974 RepID=A0A1H7IYD2_9EURY|nr:hypothetical protein [Methanobrevibacter gottschalkii]SEK66680.1 hypothetical protein SAMN05216439_1282 [Methanobrevibacter gottschalkii]
MFDKKNKKVWEIQFHVLKNIFGGDGGGEIQITVFLQKLDAIYLFVLKVKLIIFRNRLGWLKT